MTYIICLGWEGDMRREPLNLTPELSPQVNGSLMVSSPGKNERFPNRRLTPADDDDSNSIDANSEDHVTYKTFDGKLESAEPQCGRGCIVMYSSVSVTILFIVLTLIFVVWRKQ